MKNFSKLGWMKRVSASLKQRTFHKIVWAMNPFDQNTKLNQSMFSLLRNLEKIRKASIEPVFVLSPQFYRQSMDSKNKWPASEDEILEKMKKISKATKLKTIKHPILLKEKTESHRLEAKHLIEYCQKKEVSMIVVATHARKGFPRLMLGSFAETLLLLSPIPILFVNPHQTPTKSIENLLFPSDLGKDSRRAFVWTLDFADELKAKIYVYSSFQTSHRGLLTADDTFGLPIPLWAKMQKAEEEAASFLCEAKRANITTEFVRDNRAGPIVDGILAQTKKLKIDMISMAAKPLPRMPMMIGSITRQLVRQAPCPTYIYRPVF